MRPCQQRGVSDRATASSHRGARGRATKGPRAPDEVHEHGRSGELGVVGEEEAIGKADCVEHQRHLPPENVVPEAGRRQPAGVSGHVAEDVQLWGAVPRRPLREHADTDRVPISLSS